MTRDGYENVIKKCLLAALNFFALIKCWQIFLELNSKGLYQSKGKERKACFLVFTSSTKREIRQFHVAGVQRRQRNVI